MKKQNKDIWLRSVLVAAVCAVVAVVLNCFNVFNYFELKTYDLRMVQAAKFSVPDEHIHFIEVDQASIDWAKENYGWGWPWPREAYGRMIDFVSAGKAKSIAFDIIYSEPSIYGEEDDESFGESEKNSGIAVQVIYQQEDSDRQYEVQVPVPQIKDNAAILGCATSLMDSDDVIRRGRLEYYIDGVKYPTLGTAPMYITGREAEVDAIPRQKDGSVLLKYQKNLNEFYPYQACDILASYDAWKNGEEGIFVPEDFADGYVFVGYYAPGLFDICSTPVSQVFPGVGVHMTTLDNFLTDSFIRNVPDILNALWIILVSFLAAFAVSLGAKSSRQSLTVTFMGLGFIAGIVIIVGLSYLLFIKGIWILLVAPIFSFLLSFIVSVALSLSNEGKQKRYLKNMFSQCLSKEVVNLICDDPSSVATRKFEITAFFTDLEKFSSFSELLTASELGDLLNYYLTVMSDSIISERGTVDKFEGDAIVAMFGAPIEYPDHYDRACAAAIKMKKAEIKLNEEIRTVAAGEKPASMSEVRYSAFKKLVANKKKLFTRIGINSGEMIAGLFGSAKKTNYTMMGNNVNLASRLEGVNKQYHTNGIIISEATKRMLSDRFILRSLDRVRVVNVNTPIKLYELMDEVSLCPHLQEYVDEWEIAMKLFEDGLYTDCLEKMKSLGDLRQEDFVRDYYIYLLKEYFIQGKYPVEADDEGVVFEPGDGVFRLLQK